MVETDEMVQEIKDVEYTLNKFIIAIKERNNLIEELKDRLKFIESNAEFEQSAAIVREKNLYMLINTLEERNKVLEELVLRNEESEARRVM